MTILITGAHGQLGTELTRLLRAGRSELGAIPGCYESAKLIPADIDELDISDREATLRFVARTRPDVILNCAAMTNVDACEKDLEAAMKGNAVGPRNLAEAAKGAGAKLAHISTDYVFRGDGDKPYCEWDAPSPATVYGKSKLLGERYVAEGNPASFIVRTAWLYGREGRNFVKTILRAAREKGELTVVNDQRGNPTNAADLAHHILKIAAAESYGVYHCAGNGECSWYEFAAEIVRLAGIPCVIHPCSAAEYPSEAPRPAYSSLERLMLRCTVGDDMRGWKDALESFIRDYAHGGRTE